MKERREENYTEEERKAIIDEIDAFFEVFNKKPGFSKKTGQLIASVACSKYAIELFGGEVNGLKKATELLNESDDEEAITSKFLDMVLPENI